MDEDGNTLLEDTVSDEINVGSAYDISKAEDVTEIEVNGKTYVFESESDNAVYAGTMPDGGVEITRVYALKTHYYQVKYVYTGYDADGEVIYSEEELGEVQSTYEAEQTVTAEDTKELDGYEFTLVGEESQSASIEESTEKEPNDGGGEPGTTPEDSEDTPETGDKGFGMWGISFLLSVLTLVVIHGRKRYSMRIRRR